MTLVHTMSGDLILPTITGEPSPLGADAYLFLMDAGYDMGNMTPEQQIQAYARYDIAELPSSWTVTEAPRYSGVVSSEYVYDAMGNYVALDGTIVITNPYSGTVGSMIKPNGDVILPDGTVITGDGSVYAPGSGVVSATKEDGSILPSMAQTLELLRAGTQLASVIVSAVNGTPVLTPGVPINGTVRLPYPADVRLPDGRTVTYPAGTIPPVGSTVIRPLASAAQGVGGGFMSGGMLWVVLGGAAVLLVATSGKRRA